MKKVINLKNKLNLFSDYWSPRVIAEMNDYQFKLVKIKGDFIPHKHDNTDEVFIVLEGVLKIEFNDKIIEINSGEMIVVPKNEIHKPYSDKECKIMLIEPKNIVNTGDAGGSLTALNNQWI
ncbi:MAG: mannose-6-phosphate isomerase-like protein (cupin superfamily) [Candidatus Marivariicella framensis]|jgi:mannose-6-phosphate isomerase-like protein (cupin superfamily)|tara:strand:- start:21528 stop:21890 length:363 start_codon:yes stop_codon:yes gene_type:complete